MIVSTYSTSTIVPGIYIVTNQLLAFANSLPLSQMLYLQFVNAQFA